MTHKCFAYTLFSYTWARVAALIETSTWCDDSYSVTFAVLVAKVASEKWQLYNIPVSFYWVNIHEEPARLCFDPLWLVFSLLPVSHTLDFSVGHRKWVFQGREWAGVHGVRSAGQGPAVEGRIQRYGILPGGSVSVCVTCSVLLLSACGRNCVFGESLVPYASAP